MRIEDLIKETQEMHEFTDYSLEKESFFQQVKNYILKEIDFTGLDYTAKIEKVRSSTWRIIEEVLNTEYKTLVLNVSEKSEVLERVLQIMFGYGVIEPYIKDDTVTEIMVNGTNGIFFERNGKISLMCDAKGQAINYQSEDEILHVIDKIVAPINRKVDQSNPIVDARLPDGSRVNIVIPPASIDGPVITIRKFPEKPFLMTDLIKFGALSKEVSEFLEKLVRARYNIVVAGGTGSGKTTFLNALSNYVQSDQRIITVEDSAELQITQLNNLIRMEARPPNIEGNGEITIRDLVKSALRMRPDRIVVGEVRGGEAIDMLQAMNTGHDGSLTTGHANSSKDMLSRLETMVLTSGIEIPLLSIKQQIASAVDIIVFLKKLPDGSRVLDEVIEILGVEDLEIKTNQLVKFKKIKDNKFFEFMNELKNEEKLYYAGYEIGGENEHFN